MSDERQQLTETFAAHSEQVPDSLEVLTRANEIARTRRRTRWVVQATGMSLATAGIVAGALGLPSLVSSNSHGHAATIQPASGKASKGAKPADATTYTQTQEMQAFFDAGYEYGDAQQLGQLWNESDINQVKAEAGEKLLEGETLPVAPSGTPIAPEDKAIETFFNAGYQYSDAQTLANMWNVDTYKAKIKAGKELEAGDTPPIPPSGPATTTAHSHVSVSSASKLAKKKALILSHAKGGKHVLVSTPGSDSGESPALDAYFAAGYDYTDAQQLGQIWNETDITQIKTEAGQKLLDGDTLPIPPSETPAPPDNPANDQAVNAFFNAGYTYDDAVQLGKMWNESSYRAKIDGGKKIENGESLPIQP